MAKPPSVSKIRAGMGIPAGGKASIKAMAKAAKKGKC